MCVVNCVVLLSNWHEDDRKLAKHAESNFIAIDVWLFKLEKMINCVCYAIGNGCSAVYLVAIR